MLQGRSRYFVVPASRMPATFSFPCAINLNNRPRANLYRSPFGNSAITISPFSLDSSKSTRMPSFANLAITVFISLSKGPSQMGLNCRRKWGGRSRASFRAIKKPKPSCLDTRPASTLRCDNSTSGADLDDEIHFAANIAGRVMTTLISAFDLGRFPRLLRVMYFEEHQHSLSERQITWWCRIIEF